MTTNDRITTALLAGMMYKAYRDGLTTNQVAEQFGYSADTVRRYFRSFGLPLRPPGPGGPHPELEEANQRRTLSASRETDWAKVLKNTPTGRVRVREIVQLKIDHPDVSLRLLGAMRTPPITKDAIAAVLRRARLKGKGKRSTKPSRCR